MVVRVPGSSSHRTLCASNPEGPMALDNDRRQFLALAGLGGVAFASGLGFPAAAVEEEFHFVQLSDTHWGFPGPAVNPEAATTLRRAVAAVNALAPQPD